MFSISFRKFCDKRESNLFTLTIKMFSLLTPSLDQQLMLVLCCYRVLETQFWTNQHASLLDNLHVSWIQNDFPVFHAAVMQAVKLSGCRLSVNVNKESWILASLINLKIVSSLSNTCRWKKCIQLWWTEWQRVSCELPTVTQVMPTMFYKVSCREALIGAS